MTRMDIVEVDTSGLDPVPACDEMRKRPIDYFHVAEASDQRGRIPLTGSQEVDRKNGEAERLARICTILAAGGLVVLTVWGLSRVPSGYAVPTAILAGLLASLAAFDVRSFVLPNELTLLLAVAGLTVGLALDRGALSMHVASMIIASCTLLAIRSAYREVRGRDGLGMGDVKLLGASGAWLTAPELPTVVMIGAGAALLYGIVLAYLGGREVASEPVPFGAFLCLGIWLTWLFGPITICVG